MNNKNWPLAENSLAIFIDVQEKLVKLMDEKYQYQIEKWCKIAEQLRISSVITEQYSKGLGSTIASVAEYNKKSPVFDKVSFSCWKHTEFAKYVSARPERNLVILGMEAHICVLQTVKESLERGYNVFVLADCICSRDESEKELAVAIMRDWGATIVSSEILTFNWLGSAEHRSFKTISKWITN
ncbi:MAG: isochorismatase family protein [Lentisphaeria bacterium]